MPQPRHRTTRLAALLAVLALLVSGCGWFSGDDAPVAEATPAPVEQPDPDVEVIGADDVEVGEPVAPDAVGQGVYFVSSLYDLTGPELSQPVLVRMVLDSSVPDGTPLAVAARDDDGAPWRFVEGRLDTDRRHVEFIVSELGTFGVLAIDEGSIGDTLRRTATEVLARDAAEPEGVVDPTCPETAAARQDGYSVRSWKRDTLAWCFGRLGDERVVQVTNARAVPVRVSAPGAVDRGQTGATLRDGLPWTAWLDAVEAAGASTTDATASAQDTDTLLAPGRTLSVDADLGPGTTLLLTATDDPRSRSVQLLNAAVRALDAQVTAFGVVDDGAVPRPARLLETWLQQPGCSRVLGGSTRALVRGCLGERALSRAYGSASLLLAPVVATDAMPALLRDRMLALQSGAEQVEQRIQVARAKPDFGPMVGTFAGTGRTLTVTADGVVTETFNREGTKVATLTYQLSDPDEKGTRATATLTAIQVLARKQLPVAEPRLGQSGTFTLTRGVATSPFLRTDYCNAERAAQGRCTDPEPEPAEKPEKKAEEKSEPKQRTPVTGDAAPRGDQSPGGR